MPPAGGRLVEGPPGAVLNLDQHGGAFVVDLPGELRSTFTNLANGVVLNREKRKDGRLDCGDILRLGDTELVVEAES